MSKGMADIPEESNVDTESDGAGLGDYEDFSDGDQDKDDDYNDTQAPNQSNSEEEQDELEEEEMTRIETARKWKKKVTGISSSLELETTHFVSGNPTWSFPPRDNFRS
jgi:hypothetical protein